MTDSTALGLLACIGGLVVLLVACAFVVWLARYVADYRALRRREAEYADAWVRTHRAHQHHDRYTTADERRPE